jgi:hypothetical protein
MLLSDDLKSGGDAIDPHNRAVHLGNHPAQFRV